MKVREFKIGLGFLSAMALAACGGGGGGTEPPPPATQAQAAQAAQAAPSTIVTSVPVASYAAGTQERVVYDRLNQERGACGFGLLAQNAKLDASAAAHANYLLVNNTFGHSETSGLSGFTGVDPAARSAAQGYAATYTGEDVSVNQVSGLAAINGLMAAPYHLASLLIGELDVGVSFKDTHDVHAIVSALVVSPAVPAVPGKNQFPVKGSVLTYPCQGTTGMATGFTGESLNWTGGPVNFGAGGQAIVVTAPNYEVLVITSATMSALGGGVVPTQIVTAANDPNKYLQPQQAFIIPPSALAPNTTYRIVITGTAAGVPFTKDFTSTTGV
jgi:uncharacterized protein YkwD